MAYGRRQKQVREYRGQIPSPGRPTVAWWEDRVGFWATLLPPVGRRRLAALRGHPPYSASSQAGRGAADPESIADRQVSSENRSVDSNSR